MGNSATQLQQVYAWIKAKGIPVPTDQPGGSGTSLGVKMGNDVMSDIIAERFNWKFNRATAPAFLTNSYQQDYPQIGLVDIGWLEDIDKIDINNTAIPKPLNVPCGITIRRDLSRTSLCNTPVNQICWKYNRDLSYGVWPGAHVTFNPLIAGVTKQNPIMSMIDANGNRLVVSNLGASPITTGNVAPVLAANSAEGATVNDGGVVWTVVSGDSQGYRVFPLPGATGPVYQVIPYYQVRLQKLATLASLINPIPEEYNRIFQRGLETQCKQGSPNPQDRAEGIKEYGLWIAEMMAMIRQGNREADSYMAIPACSPVESVYGYPGMRNAQDPSDPY